MTSKIWKKKSWKNIEKHVCRSFEWNFDFESWIFQKIVFFWIEFWWFCQNRDNHELAHLIEFKMSISFFIWAKILFLMRTVIEKYKNTFSFFWSKFSAKNENNFSNIRWIFFAIKNKAKKIISNIKKSNNLMNQYNSFKWKTQSTKQKFTIVIW